MKLGVDYSLKGRSQSCKTRTVGG